MAAFIGEIVLVTLRNPNNAQVRGRVTDIANQELTLKDGRPERLMNLVNTCHIFFADEFSGLDRIRPTIRLLRGQRA